MWVGRTVIRFQYLHHGLCLLRDEDFEKINLHIHTEFIILGAKILNLFSVKM